MLRYERFSSRADSSITSLVLRFIVINVKLAATAVPMSDRMNAVFSEGSLRSGGEVRGVAGPPGSSWPAKSADAKHIARRKAVIRRVFPVSCRLLLSFWHLIEHLLSEGISESPR
jgi:hypothetical protein